MTLKRRIRWLLGAATIVTLLILVAADTIHTDITLSLENKVLLVSLASALLGIDIAWDQIPITMTAPGTQRQAGDQSRGEDGD